ncbi:hypothetical protein D3C76_1041120 [compost metagenome]
MRRLGAGFPPLDVRLDLVQLAEGASHAVRGFQHLVEVFALDPVGQQRGLQCVLGALAQAALAGEARNVPEVRPGTGRAGQLVGVVGQHHGPDIAGYAAFADGAGHVAGGLAEHGRVDALEQTLLAAAQQLGAFHFHHVPGHLADIDHGLDLGQLAVVLAGHHLAGATLFEGFEVGRILRGLGGAAKGNHSEAFGLGQGRGAGGKQHGEAAGGVGARVQGLEHGDSLTTFMGCGQLLRQLGPGSREPARGTTRQDGVSLYGRPRAEGARDRVVIATF